MNTRSPSDAHDVRDTCFDVPTLLEREPFRIKSVWSGPHSGARPFLDRFALSRVETPRAVTSHVGAKCWCKMLLSGTATRSDRRLLLRQPHFGRCRDARAKNGEVRFTRFRLSEGCQRQPGRWSARTNPPIPPTGSTARAPPHCRRLLLSASTRGRVAVRVRSVSLRCGEMASERRFIWRPPCGRRFDVHRHRTQTLDLMSASSGVSMATNMRAAPRARTEKGRPANRYFAARSCERLKTRCSCIVFEGVCISGVCVKPDFALDIGGIERLRGEFDEADVASGAEG